MNLQTAMTPLISSCLAAALGWMAVMAEQAVSQEKAPNTAYLNEEEAGLDFQLQGEYSGTISADDEQKPYGVQIIALGDGEFRAVGYPGGLPGDGWTKEDKVETNGTLKGDTVTFRTDHGLGVLQKGQLTVKTLDGSELGTLKKVVRKSPTLGKKPPEGATVLFDGSSADNFQNGRMTDDGLLMEGTTSKQTFQDFTLHLEFQLSFMPYARGQGRSNSGVYMQGRYEVQILDSFGLKGEHNECGGIYSVKDPDVNMCFPPLSWQTYDVQFTAARFDSDGNKVSPAKMTVKHNGVLIHEDVEVPKATTASPLQESPEPGPIYIQNHGNPLRFRNIWVVETN